jgi:hypothetical protein
MDAEMVKAVSDAVVMVAVSVVGGAATSTARSTAM